MRMPYGIEVGFTIETHGFDDQGVAIPAPSARTQPGGHHVLWESLRVRWDRAAVPNGHDMEHVPSLVHDAESCGCLDDLNREGRIHGARQALGQTLTGVIALRSIVGFPALLAQRS